MSGVVGGDIRTWTLGAITVAESDSESKIPLPPKLPFPNPVPFLRLFLKPNPIAASVQMLLNIYVGTRYKITAIAGSGDQLRLLSE